MRQQCPEIKFSIGEISVVKPVNMFLSVLQAGRASRSSLQRKRSPR